jgi:O-antigen ligase/polysaccharide polymerase Wzy-like membrane protein
MANEASSRRAKLSVLAFTRDMTTVRSRPLAQAVLTLPPLALVAVAALLGLQGGGVVPEQWAPVALGTALGLAGVAAVGAVTRIPRCALPALGALFAFAAWSALSLLWSQAPGATVDDVARLALFALAMAIGASYASRASAGTALAAGVAVSGAFLAILVEAKILISTTSVFLGPRLAWPIDYPNGTAALLWLPLPALFAGAATERLRPLGRVILGGAAALATAEGLMTLSRGAAIALVATLIVCVLLAAERARVALTLVAVLAPVAVFSARLTSGKPGDAASDATSRAHAAAFAAGLAVLLVAALVTAERVPALHFRRIATPLAVAIWTCMIVGAIGLFAAHYGRPDTWLESRWHEFRSLNAVPGNASRFGTAASNRYDYWRVAARTAEAHPLGGVGAGAFAVPWYRHRAINESVTDPHSWEAGALSETGAVGLVLLAAAFVLPFVPLARARHDLGTFTTVALGGGAAFFVLHASLDWLLRIPAVAIPGFLLLGGCAAAGGTRGVELVPGRQRAALVLSALAAALCAVPIYFATTLTARAETQAATSTRQALDTLSLASQLHPWAVEPLVVRSAILLEAGRRRAAVHAAREATARGPQDWTAWLTLADAERAAGQQAAALTARRRAHGLNPKEVQLRGVSAS